MRTLPCPPRNQARDQLALGLEVYEWKGQQKGYPAAAQDLDRIVSLYDAYDAALGAPSEALEGRNLDQELRLAIQAAYSFTQRGRKLSAIRDGLMQGLELCPICGISPPRALDHYLPITSYHPLAIYVRNLVPLCSDCNHFKGATVATVATQRFVHPYLEPIPDVPFLRAAVTIENSGLVIEFGIDPNADVPDLLQQRLTFQFQRLRLQQRYARELNTYLTSHVTAFSLSFQSGQADAVRSFLSNQRQVELAAFHRNHWRPAVLAALSDHPEFCAGGFTQVLPAAQSVLLPGARNPAE